MRVGERRRLPAWSRTSRINSSATSASVLRCSKVPPFRRQYTRTADRIAEGGIERRYGKLERTLTYQAGPSNNSRNILRITYG